MAQKAPRTHKTATTPKAPSADSMLNEIIAEIKKKRELSSLDDEFVKQKVEKILKQDKKLRSKVDAAKSFKELARSTAFADLKKLVRAELRSVYGVFDLDEKKERAQLLEELRSKPGNAEIILRLLRLHQSSNERVTHYLEIYKRLFAITGEPTSILDLGCGANPYGYPFLGCRPRYLAMDLPSESLHDIKSFFAIEGIPGDVAPIDLVKEYEQLDALAKRETVDVVFLFKVLDSLELTKRHISNKVIDALCAAGTVRWIVVSFPTVSIGGGKHIKQERRAWFERLLARRELSHEKFEVGEEAFYVISTEQKRS